MIINNTEEIDECTYCVNLESVSIVDGAQIIGAYAFSYCDIGQIFLPPTITTIEEGAFANSGLYEINIPEGVSVIENNTFGHCLYLIELCLPNSIKKIGRGAFSSCHELIQINIPSEVNYIGDDAFANCRKLKRITIPQSVSHIGCAAFNGCSRCDINCLSPYFIIKDFALYTNDMHILISCFTDDTEFVIPDGVKIIGKYAFSDTYLYRIVIPKSVVSIEEYAMTCGCLRKITIPGNVKSIKDRAFWYSDLEEVNILEGVESIGNEVFYACRDLKNIKLPLSIKSIGENVFAKCYNLTSIYTRIGSISKFEKLLPDDKYLLMEQNNYWKEKERRSFSPEEIAAVAKAEVITSQYGNSVCFYMNSGGQTYIPLSPNSSLKVGDTLDLKTAKLIILSHEGDDDIYKVIE